MSFSATAEWVKLVENDIGSLFVDPATIQTSGNFRKVWRVVDLKRSDEGVMSRRLLDEYDCKGARARSLSLSTHSGPMAGGKVLLSGVPSDTWDAIPHNTPLETIFKFVCAR